MNRLNQTIENVYRGDITLYFSFCSRKRDIHVLPRTANWDQNPKFTPLSETSSIPASFILESSLGVIVNCAFRLTLIPCFPLFQINDSRRLDVQIEKYFSLVQINNKLEMTFGDSLHLLHSSQLIMEPKKTLMEICEFLELHCDQKYVNDCASIVYKEGTKTRHYVVWTDKQKKLISEKLQGFPSIKDYNFYNWEKAQDILFNFQEGLNGVLAFTVNS